MSCQNCLNLKIGRFTYSGLLKKWNEIYYPNPITPGYRNKMLKEAERRNVPFEEISLRFIYCSQGILSRFYIVRGKGPFKAKAGLENCKYYQ